MNENQVVAANAAPGATPTTEHMFESWVVDALTGIRDDLVRMTELLVHINAQQAKALRASMRTKTKTARHATATRAAKRKTNKRKSPTKRRA